MSDHPVLLEAQFQRNAIKTYWFLQPTIVLACMVVTIPLIPIAWLISALLIDKYLDRLSCTLTERTLEVKKGVLVRTESTVPLDKVTDLQMVQGPIMRMLGLQGFRVETAGQTTTQGMALLNIVGITDTAAFRKAVLLQRDRLSENLRGARVEAAPTLEQDRTLGDIRGTLLRIEQQLASRGR